MKLNHKINSTKFSFSLWKSLNRLQNNWYLDTIPIISKSRLTKDTGCNTYPCTQFLLYEFSFKIWNNHLFSFLSVCLHVEFQKKNLVSRFREESEVLIFGLKMTHFPHFEHDISIPLKSKTITLNHFLMPVIRNRFRENFNKSVDFGFKKWPISPFVGT